MEPPKTTTAKEEGIVTVSSAASGALGIGGAFHTLGLSGGTGAGEEAPKLSSEALLNGSSSSGSPPGVDGRQPPSAYVRGSVDRSMHGTSVEHRNLAPVASKAAIGIDRSVPLGFCGPLRCALPLPQQKAAGLGEQHHGNR